MEAYINNINSFKNIISSLNNVGRYANLKVEEDSIKIQVNHSLRISLVEVFLFKNYFLNF